MRISLLNKKENEVLAHRRLSRSRQKRYAFVLSSVTVTIKARRITVKGPKGETTKDLTHLPIEFRITTNKEGN